MYKYLLFCYDTYYPRGGMNDCFCKFDNMYKLKKYVNSKTEHLTTARDIFMNDYVEIYDIENDLMHQYKINRDISHQENAIEFFKYCKEEIGISFF